MLLYKQISASNIFLGYKFEWSVGNDLIEKLFKKFNLNSLYKALSCDFADPKNIEFFGEKLLKDTLPIILDLKTFPFLTTLIGTKNLGFFILSLTVQEANHELLLNQKNTCLLNLVNYLKTKLNITEDRDVYHYIKVKTLNIKNIFAKLIGSECCDIYIKTNILTIIKKQEIYYKFTNKEQTICNITQELPLIYPAKENLKFKLEKENNITILTKPTLIPNDSMEGTLNDEEIWHNMGGSLQLNLDFLIQFLKTFLKILKKSKKNIEITEEEQNFLNQLYNINLKCFNGDELKFLLNKATNFRDLKKGQLPTEQVRDFRNKIYQKKFLLLEICKTLSIFLRFKRFFIKFNFDFRGRGYPKPPVFNHLNPLVKYMLNFQKPKRTVNITILNTIREQAQNLYPFSTTNVKKITLLELSKNVEIKKLFECFLLYSDLYKAQKNKSNYEFSYVVDMCSSGYQVNALLTRIKKIADNCGLLNNRDLHTESITFLNQNFNQIKSYFKTLITYTSVEFKDLLIAFATKYPWSIKFNKNLPKNFYIDFFNLNAILIQTNLIYTPPEAISRLKYLSFTIIFKQLCKSFVLTKFNKTKVKFLILLIELQSELLIISDIENNSWLYLTRNLIKHHNMIKSYGGKFKSCTQAIKKVFYQNLIKTNRFPTDHDNIVATHIAGYIYIKLNEWFIKIVPENMLLLNLFQNLSQKQIKPPLLINNHFSWLYIPSETTQFTKNLGYKYFKLQKFQPKINFNKVKSGFLANYIQFSDSYICSLIIKKCKIKNIKILTIHDSFRCAYEDALQLKEIIFESYLEFFDENFLIKHFSSTPLVGELNAYKINNNIISFSRDEIKKDFLCKI